MDKVEIENATIWNADCLQVLADMPENSVDRFKNKQPGLFDRERDNG